MESCPAFLSKLSGSSHSSPDVRWWHPADSFHHVIRKNLHTVHRLLGQALLTFNSSLRSVKLTVFLTVSHNIFCNRLVEIPDTYSRRDADAVFRSTPTRFTQSSTTPSSVSAEFFLVHIMLILTDTDGFRINLDQLCQRILQTSGDRWLRFAVPHQSSETLP